ncbi:MAG: 16S rRNA (adenine(1518)-N(6)/adenine(1519)-N(6))-dimethyltransferase RsmA [Patescibacteria group bacterium]|jgi:16S rRNA (adenine1518-N6/adenine1519-N6)-dimethyltransferase
MNDLLAKTREICRLFEIRPQHQKGQNFLINEKIYDDIVKAAGLEKSDLVLEVGPGLGFLTAKLAARVRQVIAVELDQRLANYLQIGIDTTDTKNVEIIPGDILRFNREKLAGQPYKIVANLPYNITSIFLRQFLSTPPRPISLVLMLQKEVAQRITASPPEMSILAVSVQYYATAEIIREVKAGNFWPEPQVDSAIVKITVKPQDFLPATDKKFFQMVKAGFSAKRKMLKNNLAGGLHLEPPIVIAALTQAGFDERVRAEELSVEDWQKLFAALTPFVV